MPRSLRPNVRAGAPSGLGLPGDGKTDQARKAFEQAEELGLKPETRDPLERGVIERFRRQLVSVHP